MGQLSWEEIDGNYTRGNCLGGNSPGRNSPVPGKSRVGFISFIIFVLKTMSMCFDLTCAHEKAEITDLKKLTIFV